MDVITFGPEKPGRPPRRPLRRPSRRAVVAGVATAVCAAILVAGIVATRRGGDPVPSTAAPSTTAAKPSITAAAPGTAATTVPVPDVPAAPAGPRATPCPAGAEMAALVIGGVPLGRGRTMESCDRDAGNGPWTVVVRRQDGTLGRHGAVVTFPTRRPAGGLPVTVNGVAGMVVGDSVTWRLARSYARIRGDLDEAELVAIAARTRVNGGRPRVDPPRGYDVVWSGPYRAPAIHEVRYGSEEVGEAGALGSGLTYTGLTSGGGFEDQLYLQGAVPGGVVGGARAVVSDVGGGNATLAWESQPGMVAYIGYSGASLSDSAVAALLRLAARTSYLSQADWWSSHPQTVYQANEPG